MYLDEYLYILSRTSKQNKLKEFINESTKNIYQLEIYINYNKNVYSIYKSSLIKAKKL